ncbi:hypothetical protein ABW21_db0205182 [Orbilia brochopaga]|nr:hypothetical protein ABW21_db0205182 [Drechslerella brochopaga]
MSSDRASVLKAAAAAVKTHLGLSIRPSVIEFAFDDKDKKIAYHWSLTENYGYNIQFAQTQLILGVAVSNRKPENWTTIECAEIEKLIVNKALIPIYNKTIGTFHTDSTPLALKMENSHNFTNLTSTDQTGQLSQNPDAGLSSPNHGVNIEEKIDSLIQLGRDACRASLEFLQDKAGKLPEQEWGELYEFIRDTMIGLNRGLDDIKTTYTAHFPPMFVTEDRMNREIQRVRGEWEKDANILTIELNDQKAMVQDLLNGLQTHDNVLTKEQSSNNKLEHKVARLRDVINTGHREIFSEITRREDATAPKDWTVAMYRDTLEDTLAIVTAMEERGKKLCPGDRIREDGA